MPLANSNPSSVREETSQYPQIDRRSGLSLRDFHREYRAPGKPVVILDAIEDWRARKTWTFEFFKSRYPTHPVLTYRYEGDRDRYRPDNTRKMALGEYINGVLSG